MDNKQETKQPDNEMKRSYKEHPKDQFSEEDIKFHEENHTFSSEKSFDYDKITDEIYMGTNMCCQIGYSRELLEKGVRGDISLEAERVDNPFGVHYFLWLPVVDTYPPSHSQFELGVQTIDFFVRNKMPVYVHCKNGHGRAPTLVIAYFINQGMEIEEAIEFVKERRPSIHPNERQREALVAFQEGLTS